MGKILQWGDQAQRVKKDGTKEFCWWKRLQSELNNYAELNHMRVATYRRNWRVNSLMSNEVGGICISFCKSVPLAYVLGDLIVRNDRVLWLVTVGVVLAYVLLYFLYRRI